MTWFVSRILIDASDTHVNYGMLTYHIGLKNTLLYLFITWCC